MAGTARTSSATRVGRMRHPQFRSAPTSIIKAMADGEVLQIVVLLLTLMLTSKGVAGVPRASLVVLVGTLASFGLRAENVIVILSVDELRTWPAPLQETFVP